MLSSKTLAQSENSKPVLDKNSLRHSLSPEDGLYCRSKDIYWSRSRWLQNYSLLYGSVVYKLAALGLVVSLARG